MKSKILAVAALASLLAAPVFAQGTTAPRADARQANQDARIQQGVDSGSLTKREAARLDKGQQHVQNLENKATADGKVTKVEKARIEAAQDRQSARIAKQKHDRQHDKNHDGMVDKKK